MSEASDDQDELEWLQGDPERVAELFVRHRARLRRTIDLRLDRRIARRVDPSDVLQEAYLDARRRVGEYLRKPDFPPFLWLRYLTVQRMWALHRHHGAAKRDAFGERPLHRGPHADATSLADQLLANLTSPSQRIIKAEKRAKLAGLLASLEEIDREVIALRNFEELSCIEAAAILGISPDACSKRYLRALVRLRAVLGDANDDSVVGSR